MLNSASAITLQLLLITFPGFFSAGKIMRHVLSKVVEKSPWKTSADFRYELLVFEISIGYLESESLLQASSEGPYEASIIILYKMCTCPSYLYLTILASSSRKTIYLFIYLFSF